MSGVSDQARIDRVEGDVATIRGEVGSLTREVGGLKADVKGLGSILGRIEQGVTRAQEKSEERDERSKPNLIAVISVLITIIATLVGGAWLVGGQLARLDERDARRDVELGVMRLQIERNDQRQWQQRFGGGRGGEQSASQ